MRRLVMMALATAALMIGSAAPAAALQNPDTGHNGSPVNTCGPSFPVTPGDAVDAPGSPFNPSGRAGQVYAGNPGTASLAHSNSTAAVAQYDTACVRLSSH
jgi:hypothetical protein